MRSDQRVPGQISIKQNTLIISNVVKNDLIKNKQNTEIKDNYATNTTDNQRSRNEFSLANSIQGVDNPYFNSFKTNSPVKNDSGSLSAVRM